MGRSGMGKRAINRSGARRRFRPGLESLEERTVPSAGDLDLSFGSSGKVFNTLGLSGEMSVNDMVVQEDGKILLGGRTTDGIDAFGIPNAFLTRLHENGTIDSSFAGGVTFTITQFDNNEVTAIELLPGGKILTLQNTRENLGPGSEDDVYRPLLKRYLADGSNDTSFGEHFTNEAGNILLFDFGIEDKGTARQMAIQADGRIVVVGTVNQDIALARLNPDGTYDANFNGNGRLITVDSGRADFAEDVLLQPDGKILVVANSYADPSGDGDFLLRRYNPDGSPDLSFGSGGKVLTDLGGDYEEARAAALLPNGKILAVGFSNATTSGEIDVAIVRYNADGSVDTSFNFDGKVTTDFGGDNDGANSIVLLPDGRFLVGGSGVVEGQLRFVLGRYLADGTLDEGFGTHGKIVTGFAERVDNPTVALSGPGTILLGGGTINTNPGRVAVAGYIGTQTPVADAGGPYAVAEGQSITLSGVGSSDDDTIALYEWDLSYSAAAGFHAEAAGATTTFSAAGLDGFAGRTRTIALRVTDSLGKTSTIDTATVSIDNVAPSVITGTNQNLAKGQTLARTGAFIDTPLDSWTATVDYGDGTGPIGLPLYPNRTFPLVHTYSETGTYIVTVVVTDDDGGSGSDSFTVTVTNTPPTLSIGGDTTLAKGEMLQREGSFVDPDIEVWEATVDYGDGAGVEPLSLNPEKTFLLSHAYAVAGTYTVTVSLTDAEGAETTSSFDVVVPNIAPSLDVGGFAVLAKGESLLRQGIFTDPDPDAWVATVDYGDGAGAMPLPLLADHSFVLQHSFAKAGTYTVSIHLADGDGGEAIAGFNVVVPNVVPTLDIGGSSMLAKGEMLSRQGTFLDPDPDTWVATVDYGDGSGTNPLALASNKSFVLQHSYAKAGTYTVTVHLADDDGGNTAASFQVVVPNIAPTLILGDDAAIGRGATFARSASFVDPDPDTWVATVDYGEGAGPQPLSLNPDRTFALNNPYETAGTYTVRVELADDDGGSTSGTVTIQVFDPVGVASVVVNDGSVQRSKVNSITVDFSGEVVVDAGAFELAKESGDLVALDVDLIVVDGRTQAVLRFHGADIIGGSLADGAYTLTIRSDRIRDAIGQNLDGDGDGFGGGEYRYDFFRRFGDTDGDGDTDKTDNELFKLAFGTTALEKDYLWYLDYDADGDIDRYDKDQFFARMGQIEKPKGPKK